MAKKKDDIEYYKKSGLFTMKMFNSIKNHYRFIMENEELIKKWYAYQGSQKKLFDNAINLSEELEKVSYKLDYKGHTGEIVFYNPQLCYYGVKGLIHDDTLMIVGQSMEELQQDFNNAVEEYVLS